MKPTYTLGEHVKYGSPHGNQLAHNAAGTPLEIYPKESKSAFHRDTCLLLCYSQQPSREVWMPTNRYKDKMWHIYTMRVYCLGEWNHVLCREVDGTENQNKKWKKKFLGLSY